MKKVLIIAGPTGVGKTSLSVKLAKKFNGEIISGDAYQVYKELTIGTAKITPEEMEGVKHYLVDCFNYTDEYHVKSFQEYARKYIDEISSEQKLPVICGGTGLYIKSCVYDYIFKEQVIDEEYKKELELLDNDTLYEKLLKEDPGATKTIHKNNRKRIIRALLMAQNGEKKSELLEQQEHKPIYDIYVIGLTMERSRLYERINKRVDIMMENGLLDEIQSVVKDESTFDLQSMQGIGYKEWRGYFKGEMPLEDTVELIKKNSRNFAKRQYTWFNNQMDVNWYDIEEENWLNKVIEDVNEWLNK